MAKKKTIKKKEPLRQLDKYFLQYAESHRNPVNVLIHWVCVPLIAFSILGLVWSIPLQLNFLGKYKDYFNFASILIGLVMYYYIRLSPILSYGMFFTILIFSYLIVQLEYWEKAGGPAMWMVCLVLFIIAWVGQFIGHKIEGKKPSFLTDLKFLLIGPLWLWSKLYKTLNIGY